MQVPNSGQFMVKASDQKKDGDKRPIIEEGRDLRANKTNGTAKA